MPHELQERIRRIHAAFDNLRDGDLSSVKSILGQDERTTFAKIDFNANSNASDLQNAAFALVANIASLKDHLKAWCKAKNVQFTGDELINGNKSVALIHDLWNIDKHAELTKEPRSGHRPSLSDLRTALVLTAGAEPGGMTSFSMDPQTGKIVTSSTGGGSAELSLVASVIDENGVVLGDFHKTCVDALEAWQAVIVASGVALST